MKIDKGIIKQIVLIGISGVATMALTYLEVKDTIDECRDMYREELKQLVDEHFENRANAS